MRARTVPLREVLVAIVASAPAFVVTPAVQAQDSGRGQTAPRSRAGSDQPPVATPWTKFCAKGEDSAAAPVCMTFSEATFANGQSARVTLIEREGQQRRIMRAVLPGNMNFALGARAVIDQGQAFTASSFRCQPSACTAEFNVTPEMLARLEGGRMLSLQSVTPGGQAVRFPMPLADFAGVRARPPNDPRSLEAEQQRKLQDELQRRAEDMRRNLQQPPDKLQEELEKRADELRRRMERFPTQMPDSVRR
jgi:invasion protein IalB